MPELRWLLGTSRRLTVDLAAIRGDLSQPTLVDKMYCSPAVDAPGLYVGGALVATGECVPVESDEIGVSDEEHWFELRFFLNKPQLPLYLVVFTEIELEKKDPGNWPALTYMTGAEIEPAASPSSCFVPLQRLDGEWNVLLFRFGRARLQAAQWVKDPKELEASVSGFKLSPDLAIA